MMIISDKAKEIINEHVQMLETCLPDFLASYYIYGSVSLGAFDFEKSDIDFIAVIKRTITETELKILKKIHSDMHRTFRKTILDGMYLLNDDIAYLKYNHEISCLRFNDGEFKGFQKFDRDSIDAFQLIKYGITVKGQETGKPDYKPDFDIIIRLMRDNLNSYWYHWLLDSRKFPSIKYISLLFSPKSVEWGVLGVSRQYYTFRERDITTKVKAGEYAVKNLPEKWHKILKEAMRLRKNNHKSYYNTVFERRNDALDYIDFIIHESNKLFDEKK